MPNGTLPVKIKTDGQHQSTEEHQAEGGVAKTEIITRCAADTPLSRPQLTYEDLQRPGGRRRLLLAYGKWTTVSGREVVHTRRYHPIWVRVPGGQWKRANYAEFVRGIDKSEWFYHDGHSEQQKVRLAEKAMVELGILLPPKGRQVPRNLFYGDEFPDGVYGS